MNSEKMLVKLKNVPKYVSMRQLWMEITKLMKYSYMAANDLAGIYIDTEPVKPTQLPYWYLYFFQLNSINKLKRACNDENGKLVLYIINSKIEVIFPGRNTWSLSMMTNVNLKLSNREIKVKTKKYEAIVDILKNLDHRLTLPQDNQHPIESCVQAKELTFIKFKSPAYAARAIEELMRYRYDVSYARSYLCLCLESNEDEAQMTIGSQIARPEIPSTSNNNQQETLALKISKEPIAENSHNTIIKIGSIRMKDFIKKFKIHDKVHFTLTSSKREQQQTDNDVVMIDEEVDLSDQ